MEKVKKYFERIGLELPAQIVPDSALLKKLQFAHCTTVPYENLDILRQIPLSLEPEALYEKVVVQGKGGFCFELNGLFAWLLEQLGYKVTEYAARYLRGESSIPMRRHRVMKVEAIDGVWICDVGIGEVCPRYPVQLVEGLEQPQFDECYRLDKDPFLGWVLMDLHHGQWRQFYSFTEEPQLMVDYIAPTFYCEKHPDSPFIRAPMLAIKTSDGRIAIDADQFSVYENGTVTRRTYTNDEYPVLLDRYFGIRL